MNPNLIRAYVLACAVVCGVIIVSAVAETPGEDANPYAVISDKNMFHLNPPPPPPSADAGKPPDLQKVMLSGFQKVGDRMKVYLAIPAKDPKDTAYLSLQAGEKERDVEIVKIWADKQAVDIINTGTPMTLTIASNGFSLGSGGAVAKTGAPPGPGGPGAPGAPGGRRMPAMMGALPHNAPAASAASRASSGVTPIVVGGGGANNSGSQGFGASSSGSSYGGGAIISGGGSSPVNTVAAAPGSPASQIANSLFSGSTTGQGYQMPTPANVTPAPPEVQAATLLLHEAAGGPPAPMGLDGTPEK
jgi:hypothetical protein